LEVRDIRAARDLAQERGGFTDLQVRVHVGNNRHWLMHLFDPDGSRTEFVETAVQNTLPPMTLMAPGRAVAPPILPITPGEIPWPSAVAPERAPQGAGRYIEPSPIDFNDHAGWLQLFDGATLKGWDGPPEWRVENGTIVVHSTSPTYLIWQGGEPRDFEFKGE